MSNDIFDKIVSKSKSVNKEKKDMPIEKKLNTESAQEIAVFTESVSGKKKYKKKIPERKIQRSYYIKEKILKNLDDFCKANNEDKSEIVNIALEKFLEEFE